jgi:SanA protein
MRLKSILRKIWQRKRRWLALAVVIALLPFGAVVAVRAYSAWQARDAIYTLETVPDSDVAIVFGAQIIRNERPSAMLADRVKLAAELYRAGKVRVLLFTGDNSLENYNEPEVMRQYALGLGIPDDAITLDYAGFRTYDSCYRARDIFKVDQAILVTQQFHLDRALLVCRQLGIEAVGVAADVMRPTGYAARSLFYSQVREFPSTALSVLDLLIGAKPTFLGDPLPILAETR